jgi:FMN phosphatase YigB (HAD superfamily)
MSIPRRALALDFGRVLTLDQDRRPFAPFLPLLGTTDAAFHAAWGRDRPAYDRADLDTGAYWRRVLGSCAPHLGPGEVADLVPRLAEADFQSWNQPRHDLHALARRALDAGVPAAIVSNMPAGIGDRFVDQWVWLQRIPHRFFSADFGQIKPDEAFYRHVLDRTGWDPAEVLFIDDHGANIEAARTLGFATCHFTGTAGDLDQIAAWAGLGPLPGSTPLATQGPEAP